MANNKLYTLGYFKYRLKEAGLVCKDLIREFDENDKRYWMISISPKDYKIICTCYKTNEDVEFVFSDGKQYIIPDLILKTSSMEVIISEVLKVVEAIKTKRKV